MAIQRGGPQPHFIDRETEAGVCSVRGSGHTACRWPKWNSHPPVFHPEAWTSLPSKPFLPDLGHDLACWTVSRAPPLVHLFLSLDLKPRSGRLDPGVGGLDFSPGWFLSGTGYWWNGGGRKQSHFLPSRVLRPLAMTTTSYRGN